MLIVTLAHQRSGTKLLGSLFDSTGQIKSLGEVFSPDGRWKPAFRDHVFDIGLEGLHKMGTFKVVHEFVMSLSPGTQHIHLDLMFNQVEYPCISWNDYANPFMYSYLRRIGAVCLLLTRDIEEMFVSTRVMHLLPTTHTKASARVNTKKLGHVDLKRADLASFRDSVEFQYAMTRRFFRGYEWFLELDYSEICGDRIPLQVLKAMEAKAASMNLAFDWQSLPPLTSRFVKNPKRVDVRWSD